MQMVVVQAVVEGAEEVAVGTGVEVVDLMVEEEALTTVSRSTQLVVSS